MRWVLIILAFVFVLVGDCRADGIVLPKVVDPASVRIPDQQALISYVKGVETLVIETRFEGQGTEFAWVVPVPSKPDVSAGTLGTFPSLRAIFAPRVKSFDGLGWFICLAILPMFVVLDRLLWYRPRRAWVEYALVPILLLVFIGGLMPSLGKARGSADGPGPVVEVHERKVVGAYDVAVLSSTDPGALSQWLSDNGFAVPKEVGPEIAQYVKEGWCFVASRLRRDAGGAAVMTPHPIVLKFAAREPVYPMRLTAHGMDDALELDLYVFGGGTASCEGMTQMTTGPVDYENGGWWGQPSAGQFQVTHSAISGLTKGAMHATKLSGAFTPAQMDKDLVLHFGNPVREMPYVVSHGEAVWAAAAACVAITLVTGLVALVKLGTRTSGQSRAGVARVVLGMGLLAGVTVFFWQPRMDTLERDGNLNSPGVRGWRILSDVAYDVVYQDEKRGTKDAQTLEEARERLKSALTKDHRFSEGDGPGQYVLLEENGIVCINYVDVFGRMKQDALFQLPTPMPIP